eukprot:COSAG03_NODE_177_length_11096_cov_1567.562062_5_plen_64_part_00
MDSEFISLHPSLRATQHTRLNQTIRRVQPSLRYLSPVNEKLPCLELILKIRLRFTRFIPTAFN